MFSGIIGNDIVSMNTHCQPFTLAHPTGSRAHSHSRGRGSQDVFTGGHRSHHEGSQDPQTQHSHTRGGSTRAGCGSEITQFIFFEILILACVDISCKFI